MSKWDEPDYAKDKETLSRNKIYPEIETDDKRGLFVFLILTHISV